MGKLTTHVLDVYHGHPASDMTIELWQLGNTRERILTIQTNADGRCDSPLLQGEAITTGEYELVFHVRTYFESHNVDCPFLNQVPLRFTIFDADAHYHVPLLVSPWAYNTYRGS